MKLKLISAAILLAASTCATNAWAGESTYYFSDDNNTISNPETFHCRVMKITGGKTGVTMTNRAEKITGFSDSGTLQLLNEGENNINKVYFKAYHDPNDRFKGVKGSVKVVSESGILYCSSGEGHGRHLMPGDYH